MSRFETVGLATFLARCCGSDGKEAHVAPFESGSSFPGRALPAEARTAIADERQQAPRGPLANAHRYGPAPRPDPSFLTILLRALAAWNT
jgi:hypothetical protein